MAKMVQPTRNVIGEKVAEFCRKRDLSCYELSRRCGVPLTTIMHIVEGTTKNPGIYTMVRICRELDIPLSECLDAEI